MSEEMSDIKPCPFCGGEGEVRHPLSGYVGDEKKFIVSCSECGATRWNIKSCNQCVAGFDTEEEAIEAWNTRVENTCTIESEEYYIEDEENYFHLSCGHTHNDLKKPKYCVECGAKVVNNGSLRNMRQKRSL